jgi:hypothetical protein
MMNIVGVNMGNEEVNALDCCVVVFSWKRWPEDIMIHHLQIG